MKTMEIETKLGTILVEESMDESFPGVFISLVRNDKCVSLACIESAELSEENPVLQFHRWEQDAQEDPVETVRYTKKRVDEMFEKVWGE